jgi:hypothetical protein
MSGGCAPPQKRYVTPLAAFCLLLAVVYVIAPFVEFTVLEADSGNRVYAGKVSGRTIESYRASHAFRNA